MVSNIPELAALFAAPPQKRGPLAGRPARRIAIDARRRYADDIRR